MPKLRETDKEIAGFQKGDRRQESTVINAKILEMYQEHEMGYDEISEALHYDVSPEAVANRLCTMRKKGLVTRRERRK